MKKGNFCVHSKRVFRAFYSSLTIGLISFALAGCEIDSKSDSTDNSTPASTADSAAVAAGGGGSSSSQSGASASQPAASTPAQGNDSSSAQTAATPAQPSQVAATPASAPPAPEQPAAEKPEETPVQTPAPQPEPTPTPTPPPAANGTPFIWDPSGSQVKLVIPASAPHWQLHVFSRRRHKVLYGGDRRGNSERVPITYILPQSGAWYKQQSLAAGDDGGLIIHCNFSGKNVHNWRIVDPTKTVTGDGQRLPFGVDH